MELPFSWFSFGRQSQSQPATTQTQSPAAHITGRNTRALPDQTTVPGPDPLVALRRRAELLLAEDIPDARSSNFVDLTADDDDLPAALSTPLVHGPAPAPSAPPPPWERPGQGDRPAIRDRHRSADRVLPRLDGSVHDDSHLDTHRRVSADDGFPFSPALFSTPLPYSTPLSDFLRLAASVRAPTPSAPQSPADAPLSLDRRPAFGVGSSAATSPPRPLSSPMPAWAKAAAPVPSAVRTDWRHPNVLLPPAHAPALPPLVPISRPSPEPIASISAPPPPPPMASSLPPSQRAAAAADASSTPPPPLRLSPLPDMSAPPTPDFDWSDASDSSSVESGASSPFSFGSSPPTFSDSDVDDDVLSMLPDRSHASPERRGADDHGPALPPSPTLPSFDWWPFSFDAAPRPVDVPAAASSLLLQPTDWSSLQLDYSLERIVSSRFGVPPPSDNPAAPAPTPSAPAHPTWMPARRRTAGPEPAENPPLSSSAPPPPNALPDEQLVELQSLRTLKRKLESDNAELEREVKRQAAMLNGQALSQYTVEQLEAFTVQLNASLRVIADVKREKLEEERLCIACFESVKNVVLRPCGHLVLCETCAARVKQCPNCRVLIVERIRVFK